MKSAILLLAVSAAALSSCTTAYKSGQTPDDVYFSPARPQDEYVRTEKQDDRQYKSDDEYYDDRYLRMKVHNRTQWSDLDDRYYFGSRYSYNSYSYNNCFSNPWTPYSYWNNYYNPYYHNYVIISPQTNVALGRPRVFNLNTYNNNSLLNNNYTVPKNTQANNSHYTGPRTAGTYTTPTNSNTRNNSNNGGFLRDLFSGGSRNNSSSNSSGSGSSSHSTSSGSSGSSSSSSSSSSAPVRRF